MSGGFNLPVKTTCERPKNNPENPPPRVTLAVTRSGQAGAVSTNFSHGKSPVLITLCQPRISSKRHPRKNNAL
jgi:hypothetical protein